MSEFYLDTEPKILNGNTTSDVVWPVGPYLTGTIQVQSEGYTAWTSAVVEVKRSNDGVRFYSYPTAVTLSADGMTASLDVSGWAWVALVVTTANGAALTLHAWGCFK